MASDLPPNIFGIPALQGFGDKSFSGDPQVASAPDYLNYSRGTERVPINKATGTLLEGAGNVLEEATSVAKTGILKAAKRDVDAGVDAVNAKFGVDAITDKVASGQPPSAFKGDPDIFGNANPITGKGKVQGAPPGVAKYGDNVDSIQTAYDQGMLSNTAYHGQLSALTKQVKAQYPGFTDEVDQLIESKTGIKPAQALRADILKDKDAEERAKQNQGQKDQTWVRDNLKYLGPAAADTSVALDAGGWNNPQYMASVKANIYAAQGSEHQLAAIQAKASYDKNMAGDPTGAIERGVVQHANDAVKRNFEIKTNASGIYTPGQIQDIINQHDASGKKYTPEEITRLSNDGQNNIDAITRDLRTKYYTTPEDGSQPVVAHLGYEKTEKIIADAVAPIRAQVNRIIQGDHAIAGSIAALNKLDDEETTHQIMTQYPIMRRAQVVSRAVGPSLVSDALMTMKNGYGTVATGIAAALGQEIEAGGTPPKSDPNGTLKPVILQERLDKGKDIARTPQEKYEVTMAVTEMSIAATLNPKGDPEKARQFATQLFDVNNRNFLSKNFSPDLQPRIFSMLTSDTMTARIKELADRGHPEILQNYTQWTGNAFVGVVKQAANDLSTYEKNGTAQFKYNPESNKLEWQPNPEYKKDVLRGGIGGAGRLEDFQANGTIGRKVTQVNTALANLANVAKLEGTSVPVLFKDGLAGTGLNMGVDFANPRTKHEQEDSPFFQNIHYHINKWFNPPEPEQGTKPVK